MLTRPFYIVPQPDEGTLGPGSTGCLSPGDCPGVGIQSGVPMASVPFSISHAAGLPAEPILSFQGAPLALRDPLSSHLNIYASLIPLALAERLAPHYGFIDGFSGG